MYLTLKALHLIAVISWMVGLLYLPRIFVYHADVKPESDTYEIFSLMELRLMKYIMNPAMIASWIFGIGLISYVGAAGWLHAKIALVVILSVYHMYLGVVRKKLINEPSKYTSKYFRYINEVPTILLILIVILVVVKPF